MSDDDPLEDAAVGETVAIDHEKTIYGIDIAPVGDYGADRESRMEIVSIERVGNPSEGDFDDIRVCWREELTKQLPMHLHDEPFNLDAYRRQKRAEAAAEKIPDIPIWVSRALNLGIGYVIAIGGTLLVARELDGAITMNGEPVQFTPDVFVGVVAITLFITFVVFALPYLLRPAIGTGGIGR